MTRDVPAVMLLPPGCPGPGPRTPLVIGLTRLAITVALVLFFMAGRQAPIDRFFS